MNPKAPQRQGLAPGKIDGQRSRGGDRDINSHNDPATERRQKVEKVKVDKVDIEKVEADKRNMAHSQHLAEA